MYVRRCPVCERDIEYTLKVTFEIASKKQTSCMSCRSKARRAKYDKHSLETRKLMSESRTGSGNSFFGRKHDEETRRKIGDATLNRNQSGDRNPFYGHRHSLETRKKMSTSRAKGIAEGKISNTNGYGTKSWYSSSKTGERVHCDSLLEKFRMIQLDNDSTVLTWTKKHGIKIPYVTDRQRNYVPDFLITLTSGEKLLEEVKGLDKNAQVKQEALMLYCSNNNMSHRWIDQTLLEIQGYRTFVEEQK